MGFYLRILTPSKRLVTINELKAHIKTQTLKVELELNGGSMSEWSALFVKHSGPGAGTDNCICQIERNSVDSSTDSLGADELEELKDSAKCQKPVSASKWLVKYLHSVEAIYAFEVYHEGAEFRQGWDALRSIHWFIWQTLGGIGYVDNEGFSNESGQQITWEFDDDVERYEWQAAILDKNEKWVPFVMDLTNAEHKKAFIKGSIPKGVKLI
jgi:hypothetical protein